MKTLAMLFVLTLTASAQQRSYVAPYRPDLPFSSAVIVGNTIYLAGHLGLDAKTSKPPEKVEDEASAVLDAVKKTLEASGATMDDLVSVQVFCSDLSYFDQWNAVYRTYFKGKFPARAFLGSQLLFGARFEVQGIAVRQKKH
jgi:reactive intermediate/imine deaminase